MAVIIACIVWLVICYLVALNLAQDWRELWSIVFIINFAAFAAGIYWLN